MKAVCNDTKSKLECGKCNILTDDLLLTIFLHSGKKQRLVNRTSFIVRIFKMDCMDFFGKAQTFVRLFCNSMCFLASFGCSMLFLALRGLNSGTCSDYGITYLVALISLLGSVIFGSLAVFDLSIVMHICYFKDVGDIRPRDLVTEKNRNLKVKLRLVNQNVPRATQNPAALSVAWFSHSFTFKSIIFCWKSK